MCKSPFLSHDHQDHTHLNGSAPGSTDCSLISLVTANRVKSFIWTMFGAGSWQKNIVVAAVVQNFGGPACRLLRQDEACQTVS